MEEAEVSPGANDATSKSRCCPVSQVTGHLEALSMNGEGNDDSEEEILYAVGDYVGVGEDQLSFKRGEPLKILLKMSEHWWWAESKGNVGYIPVNHLTHNSFQQMCWQDDEYFGSYGKLKLHHEMLSDKPRTSAYQKAIKDNAHLMKDLVILDVGCGTGILSLMCAQYGQPKQVYAVEASDMADYTSEVVSSNHFSHVITVVHSYVEDLTPDQPVDLIISEWMGTLLLFEMMIESVLVARDKFLRPGGIVWPSAASLFLVPVTAAEQYSDSIDFWTAQYGFDLSCLKPLAFEEFLQKPNHSFILDRNNCLATETKLLELDISTLKVTGLEEMSRMFEFEITKSGVLHGFCTWFQVDFQGLAPEVETVSLNTGPDHGLTHWKQNLFLLDSGISVKEGDVLQGQAKIFRHSEWRRHLRFFVTFRHICKQTGENVSYEKLFYVWR